MGLVFAPHACTFFFWVSLKGSKFIATSTAIQNSFSSAGGIAAVIGSLKVKRSPSSTSPREPWPGEDHPEREEFGKCWYRPLSERGEVELALRFTLSEPITAAIPPCEEKLFWMAVDAAMNFEPLSESEKKKVQAWGTKTKPIFSYKEDE